MALQIDSITPTSINATVGTVVSMSCTASGGLVPSGSFAMKPLPVSVERVYCMTKHGNSIYLGVGYSNGYADVYVSTDNCETYSLFLDTGDNAIHSIIVRDNGEVVTTTTTESPQTGRIFVNQSVIRTYGADMYTSYGAVKFSNGNIGVAIGQADANFAGGVLLITPANGITKYSTTKRVHSLVVESNGTTAYTADYSGRVYKTTDSGSNWSQVSQPVVSTTSRCIVGLLPNNNLLYVNTSDNVWRISTDGGSTFSVWGSAPSASYMPWAEIRTTTDGIVFGATGSPTVAVYNGATWKYTTVGTGINEVWGAPLIDDKYIYAGTGYDSNDGDVWRADLYTKTLIDTSDSSVLSTVSPYNYTADIADDNKNFRWSVTDGVTTVQSALIPVNITTARRRIIIT